MQNEQHYTLNEHHNKQVTVMRQLMLLLRTRSASSGASDWAVVVFEDDVDVVVGGGGGGGGGGDWFGVGWFVGGWFGFTVATPGCWELGFRWGGLPEADATVIWAGVVVIAFSISSVSRSEISTNVRGLYILYLPYHIHTTTNLDCNCLHDCNSI